MDKIIVTVKEGRSGLEASATTTAPEHSTLVERALATRVAERIPAIFAEERKNLLAALAGVVGALRAEDIAMLEGKPPGKPEKEKPKAG